MDQSEKELNLRLKKFNDFFIKKEKEINDLFYSWYFERERYEMYIDHPRFKHIGFKTIDVDKAKEHWKLIQIYNFISSYHYKFYLTYNKNNYKGSPNEQELKNKFERIIIILKQADETLKSLNIEYNFHELYEDYHDKRIIIREIFKNIFLKYGIQLNEIALKIIFGTYRYSLGKIDAIHIITYNTFFFKSLSNQFGCSLNYPHGVFSAFFMRAAGLLNEENNFINYNKENPNFHDPFLQEKRIIKMFAKATLLKIRKK